MEKYHRKVENIIKSMKHLKQVMMKLGMPALALVLPTFAYAITAAPINAPSDINTLDQITGQAGIICILINWIFWLLIVLVVVFVLVAAFKYLTAAGDPEKVKAAGNTLLYAAIAVVVAIIAKGLPIIVGNFIGSGFNSIGC